MYTTKMLACLGALAASFAFLNVGRADDNCTGQFVQVGTTVVILDDDRNASQHMSIGIWDASSLHTTFRDTDGDTFTNEVVSGGIGWKRISGTGKYANTKASGWQKTIRTDVAEQDATLLSVHIGAWGGNCSAR